MVCSFLLFLIVMWPSSPALAAGRTVSSPVHLKINDFYVLYTSPAPPFIDENNRIMLPLRAVGHLLGARVTYEPKTKTAVVAFGDDTLRLVDGLGERTGDRNGYRSGDDPAIDVRARKNPDGSLSFGRRVGPRPPHPHVER